MAAEAPVRLYSVDDHRTPQRLADRLGLLRDKALKDLPLAQNWDDFKSRRGYILGVEAAMNQCAEVDEELSGKHRS